MMNNTMSKYELLTNICKYKVVELLTNICYI